MIMAETIQFLPVLQDANDAIHHPVMIVTNVEPGLPYMENNVNLALGIFLNLRRKIKK